MPMPVRTPLATTFCAAALALSGLTQSGIAVARNAQDSGTSATSDGSALTPDSGVTSPSEIAGQTYADLVDLALASPVVVRATIHRQSRLKPEESPGVAPGFARLYIEADTAALLVGPDLGESLRFLADVPTDAAGKVAKLTRTPVLLLAMSCRASRASCN